MKPSARTNADVLRDASSPICELNLAKARPAMLSEPFHGLATLEITLDKHQRFGRDHILLVCGDCAEAAGKPSRPITRSRARWDAPAQTPAGSPIGAVYTVSGDSVTYWDGEVVARFPRRVCGAAEKGKS